MTDLEFLDRAERLLLAVEQGCDRINDTTDTDLDSQRSGGMVTIGFANRSRSSSTCSATPCTTPRRIARSMSASSSTNSAPFYS